MRPPPYECLSLHSGPVRPWHYFSSWDCQTRAHPETNGAAGKPRSAAPHPQDTGVFSTLSSWCLQPGIHSTQGSSQILFIILSPFKDNWLHKVSCDTPRSKRPLHHLGFIGPNMFFHGIIDSSTCIFFVHYRQVLQFPELEVWQLKLYFPPRT